jgi:alcohol dehydrogenase YqhD (iron-dependent ADH family)
MKNFLLHNPTKLIFGKDVVRDFLLKEIAALSAKNILLVYGKGSIKKNGIYQQTMEILEDKNIKLYEFSGIKANPIVEDVNKAVAEHKDKSIDLVLAVGGGSVIDSAKIIAAALATNENDAWNFFTGKQKIRTSLPLFAVLTVAATGTEMNPLAVLQNEKSVQKLGIRSTKIYPTVSFLDPSYTFSVPIPQTMYGVVDVISHALENFFAMGNAPLSDAFAISIVKESMEVAILLQKKPQDYALRARVMYAATNALNNLCSYGKERGNWEAHSIGHVLSLLYDVAHGASLSIAFPAWMKMNTQAYPEHFQFLAEKLGLENSNEAVVAYFEAFFKEIGVPLRLSDIGLGKGEQAKIISAWQKDSRLAENYSKVELERLFDLMLGE